MTMKKFLNDPGDLVGELLSGFALAHADKVKLTENHLVVRAEPKARDKVALVTLGGSGHEPALSGYVGTGMLDISVPGEIFAAPGPPKLVEALRLANRPAGVLLIVLNHAGDVMSANMTLEMAEQEGKFLRMRISRRGRGKNPKNGAVWLDALLLSRPPAPPLNRERASMNVGKSPIEWNKIWRLWP